MGKDPQHPDQAAGHPPRETAYPVLDTAHERHLLERSQKGDRAAFSTIVITYRERALIAAISLVRDEDESRDLTQDAFVRAWNALQRFDLRRPFYPWYYRILRNVCLNHLKRHGASRKVSLDALQEECHLQFEAANPDPVDRIQQEQMARHLHEAISRLKPEFQEILMMQHFQELSYQEIAEALSIPIGTVMSRLYHARRRLAELMEKHRPR